MIDGLKPYCEMKDSGIEWLGEAPGHWEVRRLKVVYSAKIWSAIPRSLTCVKMR